MKENTLTPAQLAVYFIAVAALFLLGAHIEYIIGY